MHPYYEIPFRGFSMVTYIVKVSKPIALPHIDLRKPMKNTIFSKICTLRLRRVMDSNHRANYST